jgi:hypothetical protein
MAFGTDRGFTVEATRMLLERYASKEFVTTRALGETTQKLIALKN